MNVDNIWYILNLLYIAFENMQDKAIHNKLRIATRQVAVRLDL